MRSLRYHRCFSVKIHRVIKFLIVSIVTIYVATVLVVLLNSKSAGTTDQLLKFPGSKRAGARWKSQPTGKRKTEEQSISDIQETNCSVKEHRHFPLCRFKFEFLKSVRQFPCFSKVHNVAGDDCSILQYLSEVEHFCPLLPHRKLLFTGQKYAQLTDNSIKQDPTELLRLLSEPSLSWLRMRIGQMWPDWKEAGLQLKQQAYIKHRKQKKVLFFLGSMSFQPWMLEYAGRGGPLGELVQWTDLIAATYLLGHDIKVVLNASHLALYLPTTDNRGCVPAASKESNNYDMIFTDLNGMVIIQNHLSASITTMLRCKLRILDSFGTQAEFNQFGYPGKIPGGKSGWGNKDLILGQFMTLFPHTPDNSFLGFVAGNKVKFKNTAKKNKALVYGKHTGYFKGFKEYLDIVQEFFEVHATAVGPSNHVPGYVINHGSVSGKEIFKLLRESKVFIGLGFPFEGPGPLEAAYNGAVYINPKYDIPKNKLNDDFFASKPTLRKLTSQSPYMEKFVGEPHVYTIDVKDTVRVREIMKEISKREIFEPYLPKEFTHFGFAERILGYLQHQDFCSSTDEHWPPLKNRQIFLAFAGESCTNHCMRKGLICEGTYFLGINSKDVFNSLGVQCSTVRTIGLTHAPSYDVLNDVCYLQSHGLSYSCDATLDHSRRLCPCRDYEIEQVALCRGCLMEM